jgi:autoinducer 2-binding protein LuxP
VNRESQLKLVDAVYTDGKRSKAFISTLQILDQHPNVAFLYSCSTDVSLGAIDALLKTGKNGDILVNGWGGGSSELDAIVNGTMDVTVMRMNDDNGVAMAEAIRLDLEKRPDELPLVYSGDFVLVKKGISDAELKRLKAQAFRYSGVE